MSVKIFRPRARRRLPVLLFTHGAGWVFGDAHTHGRLVAELATRAGAAAVFTNYSLSPEAKYPTAIEEIYAVLEWIAAHGGGQQPRSGPDRGRRGLGWREHDRRDHDHGQAARRPADRGTTAVLPGHQRQLRHRVLPAVRQPLLALPDGMQWYWDQYTADPAQRAEITARRCAPALEDLAGLPPALVIVGEADVLRDEGEAYAAKLRQAGVPVTAVRYQGIIHDFVMVNALRDTHAAKAATAQGGEFLRAALHDR